MESSIVAFLLSPLPLSVSTASSSLPPSFADFLCPVLVPLIANPALLAAAASPVSASASKGGGGTGQTTTVDDPSRLSPSNVRLCDAKGRGTLLQHCRSSPEVTSMYENECKKRN